MFSAALERGVSNLSFGSLSGQLGATMYQFKFRIPPYYTLLVRARAGGGRRYGGGTVRRRYGAARTACVRGAGQTPPVQAAVART